MSQNQAGSAEPPVKRLKQTALTWTVKDKARSDARLAGSGVNQVGQRETVLPKVLAGWTAVLIAPKFWFRRNSAGSCFVRSQKGYITCYNFKAVTIKFQFPLYMTSVTSGGKGPPYKNIIKNRTVPFILKQRYMHIYIHKYLHTICVCMDTSYIYACMDA